MLSVERRFPVFMLTNEQFHVKKKTNKKKNAFQCCLKKKLNENNGIFRVTFYKQIVFSVLQWKTENSALC